MASVAGLKVTIIALDNTRISMRKASRVAITAAGKTFLREAKRRVGLRDHKLQDLADKDHPYARRHGSIQIHTRKPWQVHSQTGTMKNATQGAAITQPGGAPGYEVFFNLFLAPHARHVIWGTNVMLPRDPLWNTALDPVTTKKMMKAITKRLGKQLRTQVGIRFEKFTPASGGSLGRGLSQR